MLLERIRRKVSRAIMLRRHAGDRYHCPLCGYRARDLGDFGVDSPALAQRQVVGAGRRKSLCLSCGSRDRERLVFVFLRDQLEVFGDAGRLRVLHVAPEVLLARRLRSAGFAQYACGDLFAAGYDYPAYVRNMDVTDLPFPDDRFDLAICNHVLEHVADDIAAMRSIRRVLRPGGRAILQVPLALDSPATLEDRRVTDPSERAILFGQEDHVRLYGQDYRRRLESAGFVVETVNIAARYPRLGLDPREDVYQVTKPSQAGEQAT